VSYYFFKHTAKLSTFTRTDTIREPYKTTLHPELLQHTGKTDEENANLRNSLRRNIFSVYPALVGQARRDDGEGDTAPYPGEHLGNQRIVVRCKSLAFKFLAKNNSGQLGHIEPFFVTLSLYDAHKGVKISEDFHIDLNNYQLRTLLEQHKSRCLSDSNSSSTMTVGASGLKPSAEWPTLAQQALFSVTFPHPEVYLVVRVEKIPQDNISACAEPYIKTGESTKAGLKLQKQMTSLCNTLGQYRMPFAWAARPLFDNEGHLEINAEFSSFFRQEKEKLTDEDLLKHLADLRIPGKLKLVTIPGSIDVDVQSYDDPRPGVMTPSLVMVLPLSTSSATVAGDNLLREAEEFAPIEAYHPHTNYFMHLTYTHHLYVYPMSLKYDSQRNFAKARNITCCVQIKDSDEVSAQSLPFIYGKAVGPVFRDRAYTTVLHHCTTPTFYEEVKMELPVDIHSKHHLLFTFYHISCDLQRASKKESVSSVVGYSWVPLLDPHGKIITDLQSLPVSATLKDGYLSFATGRTGTASDVKFVDGAKPLFKVSLKLCSSVYTKERAIHNFFELCGNLSQEATKVTPPFTPQEVINDMFSISLSALVQHLPVIFNQLLSLLVDMRKDMEELKPAIMKLLLHYLQVLESADRTVVVKSYLEFIFETKLNQTTDRTLHDELAKELALYLKQQDSNAISTLLDHMWFFFDMILKSVAQYLQHMGRLEKLSSRKKIPYNEDLYWNLQTVVFNIQTCIRMKMEEGKKANRSVAEFMRRCFTVMDRGQVFKMMAKYLEAFKVRDTKLMFEMKFEFLQAVCEYEHFVPLNFPWPQIRDADVYTVELNEEYCQKHFLLGVLLKELNSAIMFEPMAQRKKAFRVLMNIVAKLDLDDRYQEKKQKALVATLLMPLLNMALENEHRLDTGQSTATLRRNQGQLTRPSSSYYSGHTGRYSFQNRSSILPPLVQSGNVSPDKDKEAREGNISPHDSFVLPSMVSVTSGTNRASKRPKLIPINENRPSSPTDSTSGLHVHEPSDVATAPPGPLGNTLPHSPSDTMVQNMSAMDAAIQEWNRFSVEETRDLLSCVLFILKNIRENVLLHWLKRCVGMLHGIPASIWEKYIYPEMLSFFNLLGTCLCTFSYKGRLGIQQESQGAGVGPRDNHRGMTKQSSDSALRSSTGLAQKKKEGKKSTITMVPEASLSQMVQSIESCDGPTGEMSDDRAEALVKAHANCASEASLVVLDLLEMFSRHFESELKVEHGDNILMSKFFHTLMTLLQVNQSIEMIQHIFASVRSFIHRFPETLFKGSTELCRVLCYEVLRCCNSRLPVVRSEASTVLLLILKKNWEFFKGQGIVRAHVQSTIAISELVSQIKEKSDNHLRRSLFVISNFPAHESVVKAVEFSKETSELMKRLRTVLTSSAQMKEYHNDPERLADLYFDLAQSYASSPELRKTWLNNMLQLHRSQRSYSEAAMCCLHMAGLIAQYLKLRGEHPTGCAVFSTISVNISKEESGIKQDKETIDDTPCYNKFDLVRELETALELLWEAEMYEMMGEVAKILLPYYEEAREYQLMSNMFKKLHLAYEKVVAVMVTGKRYLGTYFKVAFFGRLFKEDNGVQFIYKEPTVTPLSEVKQRLEAMYGKRFGPENVVIIQSSAKVDTEGLDPEKAYIQIIHVAPHFTPDELVERMTAFEQQTNVSAFLYETPFTKDGKAHGDTVSQFKRKTVATTENWFPYVKKRIRIIHEQSFELTPIQVGIEAIEKKASELSKEIERSPPDVIKMQLLLQGSIGATVQAGAQEYANAFLKDTEALLLPEDEVDRLKEVYREFMFVCQEALEVNRRHISADQFEYHADLERKFAAMQSYLNPLIGGLGSRESSIASRSYVMDSTPKRTSVVGNPHRLSTALFNAISSTHVV
jgi:hypothetical protein